MIIFNHTMKRTAFSVAVEVVSEKISELLGQIEWDWEVYTPLSYQVIEVVKRSPGLGVEHLVPSGVT